MDVDDPRRPLLGCPPKRKWRDIGRKLCNVESWRRRMPITIWLPTYSADSLVRDIIAGITVGLTSIPQGIAYAMVAGLPPQVGLYSSIFPGIVYAILGSCKDVTVGPTAILAALLAKYVAKSADFAYLAALLSGCVILLLGVLQLGFLLDFISKPVISGFTTAAALQISASQLKSLFRITGSSGGTFIKALTNFFKNIKTVQPWDTLLGTCTIISLLILKRTTLKTSPLDSRGRAMFAAGWLYVVRARNALVVFAATILAYVLFLKDIIPFALTGKIEGGLPHFGPPPFSTRVKNETLNFEGMLQVFGAEGLVMPLVAILESVAIAKAFAGTKTVDVTQEMVAIGACNILSSFAQSMPSTGSFTRTALNHASGVVTAAGSFFKASLVLLSVTLLSKAFYFIPRATLAGIIIVAMMSIVDFTIVKKLWISSKSELLIWMLTVLVGITAGLEYGIAAGAAADALRALTAAARPDLHKLQFKIGNQECISLTLVGTMGYACAEHVPRKIRALVHGSAQVVILDARHLRRMDIGVVENVISAILELEQKQHRFLLWNFDAAHHSVFEALHPGMASRFVTGPSIDQFVLALDVDRRFSSVSTVT
ncbi:sodium-independent sulfate anion transporter-like isoform X2 [Maniola hyperantus]|uniref:sodium-independent sulfate anion transporter-like isoform X2 n=1 Tax=Aphantopus hyperantus TaxID=2795564 RepID=UPI001567E984|nr:sodium-independent sulfate anion transporter-like isoform X1 [Maniola hyperantus]